jgi:hypothetical protein
MFVLCVIISVAYALMLLFSASMKLRGEERSIAVITGVGAPRSWIPWLAAAELAGAVGLLIGLGVAGLGIAAAIGLVLYFIGAVGAHLRVGDRAISGAGVMLVLAIASLVLRAVTL